MREIITLFNDKLKSIKTLINYIYEKTKKQYSKQKNKSFTSYMELTNIFNKRKDYEDDFQDMSKIDSEYNLILDRDGYVLTYTVEDIKFKDDYYKKDIYPLTMIDGSLIPGSRFSNVFLNNIGFWGYQSDTPTYSFFSVDLKDKGDINKVFLQTNNDIDVTLYIKQDFDKDWIEVETRSGRKHMWNFDSIECVALKFISYTNLFSVARLQAGLASYNKNGILVSQWYELENLYRIKLDLEEHSPDGTNIDHYIRVSGQPELYSITDETIITGGVKWNTDISGSGILNDNYIADSLTVRAGYLEWETVDTYDWVWTDQKLTWQDTVSFSDNYKLLQGSLRKVSIGDTIFIEDDDYSVTYDLDARTVKVKRLDNARIISGEEDDLQLSFLLREKSVVKQIRTYVDLVHDENIVMQGFPAIDSDTFFKVRHVIIKDKIFRDVTQEVNVHNEDTLIVDVDGTDSYIIKGQEGLNLIEVEFIDNDIKYIPETLPTLLHVNHFAYKYELEQVLDAPEDGQYSIDPSGDSDIINADPSGSLWAKYAEVILPSGISYIQLESRFTSAKGINTPTLRKYNIINKTI